MICARFGDFSFFCSVRGWGEEEGVRAGGQRVSFYSKLEGRVSEEEAGAGGGGGAQVTGGAWGWEHVCKRGGMLKIFWGPKCPPSL